MKLENVKDLAIKTKLFGLKDSLEGRHQQAIADGLTPIDLIGLLLEDELRYRRNARCERLTRRAKFRYDGEIEQWDTSYDRGINKAKLKELASLNFHRQGENLILLGKSGEGKTHLANAIGRRMCFEGIKTKFYSVNLFFEEVAAERSQGTYLRFLKRLNQMEVIILDDFGLRTYNHDEANVLIDLIEERYRKGTMIVTSQVNPKGWLKLFEDPVIAEAITDRLINPAMTVKLKGGSYRTKLAKSA